MKSLTRFALAAAFLSLAAHAEDFDSDGVKIHYTVVGAGEPVILIHGLYASAKLNWELPGITADIAKHYQVIALDNRGHGLSDKPTAEGEYGVKMVGDIVRLMDHLHLANAHLVGYSMGGMITLKLLATHPERVRSAVLGGMGWLQAGSPMQQVWETLGDRRAKSDANTALLRGFAEFAVTEAEVKAIRVPVQIVVGDQDPCRRLYVEPLRRVRPDWPEHLIAQAGHIVCIFQPDFKAQLLAALAAGAEKK